MTSTLDRLTAALANRYRLERELGAGGMATVYLAHDVRHEREVAIKVAHTAIEDDETRQRFLREIRLAGSLTHPHILPVHDSGEADGLLWFVMPVMQGLSLRARLQLASPLPIEEAIGIVAQVADALDFAHRRGVVHRDIKPENILLHDGHALVADFGIGKGLGARDESNMLTQLGVSLGTPTYMSPEQAAGEELDGRADLFALGCVLFELLTGKPPFTGTTATAVIAQRFIHTPPSVTTLRGDVPVGVSALVESLLEREPSRRPATGADVVRALRVPAVPLVAAAPPNPTSSPARSTLAVLPFSNVGGGEDTEYFSDGLTDEILTDLARVPALHVTSRSSSMRHKGSTQPVADIARSLHVRHLLTGSVRRAGTALRITTQLVDAVADRQLWGERFDGSLDDIFDVQERVARAIATALGVALAPDQEHRWQHRGIRSAAAYDLMLKARASMWRLSPDASDWRTLLDEADAIEPDSPVLRATRLFGEVNMVKLGGGDPHSLRALDDEATALIAQAPDRAPGYAVRGYVAMERGDMAAAIIHFRDGLERDPSDSDARYWLMVSYAYGGMLPEADAVAADLQRRDPLNPLGWLSATVVPFFTGGMDTTLVPMHRVIAVDPDNFGARWQLAYAHTIRREFEEAQESVDRLLAVAPDLPYVVQADALLHVMRGDLTAGLTRMDAVSLERCDCHLTFHIAEVYAMAGQPERAMAVLARAVEHGFTPVDFIATHSPLLAPLRGDPRFDDIVAEAARRTAAVRRAVS